MRWLKNTEGKPDAMLTVALVSLAVVLGKALLAGVTIGPVNLGVMDGGLAAALLTPTLGAYVARRWTDAGSAK